MAYPLLTGAVLTGVVTVESGPDVVMTASRDDAFNDSFPPHAVSGSTAVEVFTDKAFTGSKTWNGINITPPVVRAQTGQLWPLVGLSAEPVRLTSIYTSASLAAGARESGTIPLAPYYRILRIQTSRPARVRLYTTTAKRDADASRLVGTDPVGDHGLILDFSTTSSVLLADLGPTVDGFDGKVTPDGMIPITVDNRDTSAGTVVVSFTYVRTE